MNHECGCEVVVARTGEFEGVSNPLGVFNGTGKEAVTILGPGEFCGEGCLTGLSFRMATVILPIDYSDCYREQVKW